MNAILSMINELETVNKELANQADELKREIDRLTAMLPKVVVPEKSSFDFFEKGIVFECECRECVGDDGDWQDVFCSKCGAKMDWTEIAEVAEVER